MIASIRQSVDVIPSVLCCAGADDDQIPIMMGQSIALRASDISSDRLAFGDDASDQCSSALAIGRDGRH